MPTPPLFDAAQQQGFLASAPMILAHGYKLRAKYLINLVR
jgi:hypothetical protein